MRATVRQKICNVQVCESKVLTSFCHKIKIIIFVKDDAETYGLNKKKPILFIEES